ncbi:hypothetical protein PYCC9005_005175 [Savitreella phatthalungensis]
MARTKHSVRHTTKSTTHHGTSGAMTGHAHALAPRKPAGPLLPSQRATNNAIAVKRPTAEESDDEVIDLTHRLPIAQLRHLDGNSPTVGADLRRLRRQLAQKQVIQDQLEKRLAVADARIKAADNIIKIETEALAEAEAEDDDQAAIDLRKPLTTRQLAATDHENSPCARKRVRLDTTLVLPAPQPSSPTPAQRQSPVKRAARPVQTVTELPGQGFRRAVRLSEAIKTPKRTRRSKSRRGGRHVQQHEERIETSDITTPWECERDAETGSITSLRKSSSFSQGALDVHPALRIETLPGGALRMVSGKGQPSPVKRAQQPLQAGSPETVEIRLGSSPPWSRSPLDADEGVHLDLHEQAYLGLRHLSPDHRFGSDTVLKHKPQPTTVPDNAPDSGFFSSEAY